MDVGPACSDRSLFRTSWALVVGLFLLLSSTSVHPQNHIVSVQFHWYHQFEYAGFYAALEKGFYAQEGLEVQLLSGGPRRSPIDRVANQEVQFGVASSELLLAYLKGRPVVALAPIFQHSAAVFLTRSDSGIRDIRDFVGKRVEMGSLTTDAEAHAMLHAKGIGLSQIDQVDSTFNPQALIEGKSDVVSAYVTNQPYYMLRQGVPYRIIRPQSYGIEFYGNTLFTSKQVVEQQPELAEAFLRASIRGWEYAFKHSDEIIDLILKKYSLTPVLHNREHLEYERDQMMKLVMPGLVNIGHSNPDRWQAMADTFGTLGLVAPGTSAEGFIYQPMDRFDWGHLYVRVGVAISLALILLSIGLSFYNRRMQLEIDRRWKVEHQLQDSERRLSLALWGANLGCWDWDLESNHLHLDVRAAELLGCEAKAVDVDLNDRSKIADLFLSLEDDDEEEEIKAERFVKQGDGGRWVLIRGKRLPSASGLPRAFGTLLDVSSEHAYQEKLIKLSITDPLTGLLNRRYFFDRLIQSCSQSKRDGNLLTLALLDIDHFKRVNDKYGHQAGDETLVQFSKMLREDCRPYDLVARYGGEEFIILFYGMDKTQACSVLERYRERLRTTQIVTSNDRFYCTFSCGIADSSEIARTQLSSNEMVKLADRRLYHGKEHGRDRIVTSEVA